MIDGSFKFESNPFAENPGELLIYEMNGYVMFEVNGYFVPICHHDILKVARALESIHEEYMVRKIDLIFRTLELDQYEEN